MVIQAQGLGKRYRLGEGGYVTLREKLDGYLRGRRPSNGNREVWALRDVDLEIDQGDVVGIVGRNGAGKTTLLKTVARIVRPTTGVVRVRGRVGALLEVGTGFHPELTGRENVYLNGVVLGMSRREVRRRFDDIVEFAGVERFLDTPVKRYSSGMWLRLAFAVAAHVDPDVVIVDEVLAVGDAEFQRRCLGRMSEFGQEGRTVLFVSHDIGAVAQLCRRALWLEDARLRADGPAHDVIDAYLRTMVSPASRAHISLAPDNPIQDLSIALVDKGGTAIDALQRDEPLVFDLRFASRQRLLLFDAAVYVLNSSKLQVLSENLSDQGIDLESPGEHAVRLTIPPILPAGEYIAGVRIGTQDGSHVYEELLHFTLLPRPDDRDEAIRRRRTAQPVVRWDVESRAIRAPDL